MGRQTGVIRIRGTVGNLTFSQTENGDEVRLKTSLNGDKMRKDPRFIRTRENWAEFSRAGKAAKLIRNAFALYTRQISDRLGYPRLTSQTMKVVKADSINPRGQRNIPNGDLNYLLNYDFNARQTLSGILKAPFQVSIDRAAGTADIDLTEMVPTIGIVAPAGTTHFKIIAAASELDWDAQEYTSDFAESAEMVYGNQVEAAQNLSVALPPGSTKTLLVALGVWFYQEVNGTMYILNDGVKNTMALVDLDHV